MISAFLSSITAGSPPDFTLLSTPGSLGRHDMEARRFNAEARLRRYGMGHLRVALSSGGMVPFAVSGGTVAQNATASKLLAD